MPDIDRIDARLAALSERLHQQELHSGVNERNVSDGLHDTTANTRDEPDRLTVARAWTHAIARRDDIFGSDLFFDPVWNMLLDLYIARCQKGDLCVSALCHASKTPMTTALRWLNTLENRKLVERRRDPFDRRRSYIVLTSDGTRKVEQALDQATESDRRLGIGRLKLVH